MTNYVYIDVNTFKYAFNAAVAYAADALGVLPGAPGNTTPTAEVSVEGSAARISVLGTFNLSTGGTRDSLEPGWTPPSGGGGTNPAGGGDFSPPVTTNRTTKVLTLTVRPPRRMVKVPRLAA
jgi:hypothetical protein